MASDPSTAAHAGAPCQAPRGERQSLAASRVQCRRNHTTGARAVERSAHRAVEHGSGDTGCVGHSLLIGREEAGAGCAPAAVPRRPHIDRPAARLEPDASEWRKLATGCPSHHQSGTTRQGPGRDRADGPIRGATGALWTERQRAPAWHGPARPASGGATGHVVACSVSPVRFADWRRCDRRRRRPVCVRILAFDSALGTCRERWPLVDDVGPRAGQRSEGRVANCGASRCRSSTNAIAA